MTNTLYKMFSGHQTSSASEAYNGSFLSGTTMVATLTVQITDSGSYVVHEQLSIPEPSSLIMLGTGD